MRAKSVRATIFGVLTMLLAASSAHGLEFFAAERYDEVATLPVMSLGAPTGMVSSWGSVFVAFGGLQGKTVDASGSDVSRTDASLSFGMGLGDPINSIGSTLSLSIGSVAPDGGMAERGSFSISIGKFFIGPQLGIAIGGVDVAGWNDITKKRPHSVYVAITKILPFDEHPVIVSFGAGNTAFADIQALAQDPTLDPSGEIDGFASIAFYFTPHINFIVDSTAGVLSTGISVAPFTDKPLVLTAAAYDINKDSPGNTSVLFVGSIAYSYRF